MLLFKLALAGLAFPTHHRARSNAAHNRAAVAISRRLANSACVNALVRIIALMLVLFRAARRRAT